MEINEFSGCKERGKLDGGGEGECKMQGDKAKNRDKLGREKAGNTERTPVIIRLHTLTHSFASCIFLSLQCNSSLFDQLVPSRPRYGL